MEGTEWCLDVREICGEARHCKQEIKQYNQYKNKMELRMYEVVYRERILDAKIKRQNQTVQHYTTSGIHPVHKSEQLHRE